MRTELEPVIWVNTLRKGVAPAAATGASGAALCHVERDGLRYLVPISDEVNPLFAFAFLDSFLDTLRSYLGDVTEATVKDNFDIVYMVSRGELEKGWLWG
jgi:AP-3 complex subunit mu